MYHRMNCRLHTDISDNLAFGPSLYYSINTKRTAQSDGGETASTGQDERRLHAEDDRWPPKSPVKLVTANTQYALAA